MSIGLFDSITSGFHQQPLPSTSGIEGEGSVTTKEVIHQWDVNDFVVFLIKEQGSLKCKTTDRDQKEICTNCIEISEEDNLEEMISYLKESAVMVRGNGFVNFCSIYKTWEMNDAEESIDINLVYGPEGLAWNIFKKSTNENYFLDFQKTTIPSLQCHPETIELIEKIKTETFDNMPLLYCLMTDFQVRIIDSKFLREEYKEINSRLDRCKKSIEKYEKVLKPLLEERKKLQAVIEYYSEPDLDDRIKRIQKELYSKTELCNEVQSVLERCKKILKIDASLNIEIDKKEREELDLVIEERQKYTECIEKKNKDIFNITGPIGFFGTGPGAVYLSYNAISAIRSAGVFLGGVPLGIIAAGAAGYLAFAAGAAAVIEVFKNHAHYPIEYHINNVSFFLEKRVSLLSSISPEKLIEIEPISVPSEIDPRMRVSKFTWAVTMVVGPKGSSKNHAALIIEGLANEYFKGSVPDGGYFIHKSEFNPSIKSHLYSVRRLKHNITLGMQRTRIWMRSSKKVIKMLQEITKEQHLQDEKLDRGEIPSIAITGSDSLFSGGENSCFTWAREKCAMVDIALGKSIHSLIITRPRAFTDPFEKHQKTPITLKI